MSLNPKVESRSEGAPPCYFLRDDRIIMFRVNCEVCDREIVLKKAPRVSDVILCKKCRMPVCEVCGDPMVFGEKLICNRCKYKEGEE